MLRKSRKRKREMEINRKKGSTDLQNESNYIRASMATGPGMSNGFLGILLRLPGNLTNYEQIKLGFYGQDGRTDARCKIEFCISSLEVSPSFTVKCKLIFL